MRVWYKSGTSAGAFRLDRPSLIETLGAMQMPRWLRFWSCYLTLTLKLDGLRVRIRRSKTDRAALGQEVAVPHGARLQPVEAVRAWSSRPVVAVGKLSRSMSRSTG